jgi:hypothetical protein
LFAGLLGFGFGFGFGFLDLFAGLLGFGFGFGFLDLFAGLLGFGFGFGFLDLLLRDLFAGLLGFGFLDLSLAGGLAGARFFLRGGAREFVGYSRGGGGSLGTAACRHHLLEGLL